MNCFKLTPGDITAGTPKKHTQHHGATLRRLALMLLALTIWAGASAFTVRLRVIDTEGTPEEYATVRIFTPSDTLHAINGGVTDTLGIYTATLPHAGDYRLNVEAMGKPTLSRDFTLTATNADIDLGTLTTSVSELAAVTVTAQRPLVVKEIDRLGYDVAADDDSKTSTVSEILRKVPMVSVDADGTIRVNGSTNFLIYKNGRPNTGLSNNAKDLFRAMPASTIKRIEVITEPGARYDAEGVAAILNIVTSDTSRLSGVMGNATVRGSSLNPFENAMLYLMSQIGKVTFSVNGGVQYVSKPNSQNRQTSDFTYDNGTQMTSDTHTDNKGWAGWGGLELSYDMDSLNLFNVDANFMYFNVVPDGTSSVTMRAADGSPLSAYNSAIHYPTYNYLMFNGTASYQHSTHRPGETLSLSYMISTTGQDNHETETYSDIVGDMFPYTSRDNIYNLHFIEHTIQGDWSRPFASIHRLDLGAKWIIRRNHSQDNSTYQGWETRTGDFLHVTDIAAVYAQYGVKLGRWTAMAGLRYEYSHLKASYPQPSVPAADDTPFGTDLNDWVPSAALSWQINDRNSLSLNYATRINRPGIDYLKPTYMYTPTRVSYGNPDLASARHQSLKLSYMLIKPSFNLSFSTQYQFTDNAISAYNFVRDNVIYSSYGNIGKERNVSWNASGMWSPGTKTRVTYNLQAMYKYLSQEGLSAHRWCWGGFASVNQKLPFGIEGECWAWLEPAWLNDVYTRNAGSTWDRLYPSFSLKRNFLDQDRLTLSLTWMNVGKAHPCYKVETFNGSYTGMYEMTRDHGQALVIGISYRFGSLKASVNKVKNRITNDDLQGQPSQNTSN